MLRGDKVWVAVLPNLDGVMLGLTGEDSRSTILVGTYIQAKVTASMATRQRPAMAVHIAREVLIFID